MKLRKKKNGSTSCHGNHLTIMNWHKNGKKIKLCFNCIIRYFLFRWIIYVSTMLLKGYFRWDFNYAKWLFWNLRESVQKNLKSLLQSWQWTVSEALIFFLKASLIMLVIFIQMAKNIWKLSTPNRHLTALDHQPVKASVWEVLSV